MTDHGTPPSIPTDLLPYQSYTEDPKWQLRFSAMWCGALGLCILLALPWSLRLRNLKDSVWGLGGVRVRGAYEAVPSDDLLPSGEGNRNSSGEGRNEKAGGITTAARVVASVRLWSPPGITLNVGQILIISGYAVFALVCIVLQAPLMENPNRAGFLALAQLPPVFLFAAKNSPLTSLSLLLGPGVDYTKLNYVHRWSARFLFLGAVVHGSLWINNHVVWSLPILGRQKESSGIAALGCLCVLVLTSFGVVRRWCYAGFLVTHFLAFPAFFVTLCYHTIYAAPWIFPPLAFYGFDVLLRVFRWRVVVGRVEAKVGGMSLIHIPLARTGWRAGQHVQVRALIGGRAWEAHPLSICCAPPGEGCMMGPDNEPLGMLLAARACGDWSNALYAYAQVPVLDFDDDDDDYDDSPPPRTVSDAEKADTTEKHPDSHGIVVESRNTTPPTPSSIEEEKSMNKVKPNAGRPTHLILDGPYGGPTLPRAGAGFETVLLFAGGSGATFTLGVVDELVGRCVRRGREGGEVKTRRVVWCWCVRSFGAINWFAPYLLQIATLAALPSSGIQLSIRIYVTCLCDPGAVPAIPGCVVSEERVRPSVQGVLGGLLGDSSAYSSAPYASADPASKVVGGRKEGVKGEPDSERTSASVSVEELDADLDLEKGKNDGYAAYTQGAGGVAVFAAGPGSLIREAGNAVARANLSARGRRAGGVEFCAEVFTV
ncbi:hypothetical protein C8R43DRAFT_1065062 [Mycena crocata]|nr:hypothetical protein C8R43DRAFT_1065062 [Mycena crocata]